MQRLHENLNGESKVLDVLKWTNKVALDIVGISGSFAVNILKSLTMCRLASFRYHFGTLDGEESEFAASLDNILFVIHPTSKSSLALTFRYKVLMLSSILLLSKLFSSMVSFVKCHLPC